MIEAFFASIPAMVVLTGVLAGVAAALPGAFLVLRGQAMLTDAIAHSIVLGLVLVWLATGATAGPVLILGAAAAGLACVLATEAVTATRLVRPDAAIGLVFPAMFATGVLLISLNARNLHLDVHSVLLGEIGFVWLDTRPLGGVEVPRAVLWLAVMVAVNGAFVAAFWKELKLASFDPDLAAALGLRPRLLGRALFALTAATAVAAFDAVGVVLFVAFAVVPAAAALLLADRLAPMLGLALAIAAGAAVAGYPLAVAGDVSIAGAMALVAGAVFAAAFVAAPRHGLVAAARARAAARIEADCRTLLAHLVAHEHSAEAARENSTEALAGHLQWDAARIARVLMAAQDRGLVGRTGLALSLTPAGRAAGRAILESAPPLGRELRAMG
jgi:manganese/zinc/iron transport system permease protein